MEQEKLNNFSGIQKGKLSEQSKNITLNLNSEVYNRYRELSKKKLSLKEQDEWEDYFNEYKKDLLSLKDEIENTDNKINQMVYKFYGLSKEEIQIIDESLK